MWPLFSYWILFKGNMFCNILYWMNWWKMSQLVCWRGKKCHGILSLVESSGFPLQRVLTELVHCNDPRSTNQAPLFRSSVWNPISSVLQNIQIKHMIDCMAPRLLSQTQKLLPQCCGGGDDEWVGPESHSMDILPPLKCTNHSNVPLGDSNFFSKCRFNNFIVSCGDVSKFHTELDALTLFHNKGRNSSTHWIEDG